MIAHMMVSVIFLQLAFLQPLMEDDSYISVSDENYPDMRAGGTGYCGSPNVGHPVGDDGIVATKADSLIFDYVMSNIVNILPPPAPVSQRVIAAGTAFLGTPYVASTLETEGEERLVINLRGVDCTTLVEYVTAIAIRSRTNMNKFGDFADELTSLRYRGGIVDDYTSRLHYFTEWLKDNERKGYLTLVSDNIGDATMDPVVNFMTSNPGHYRQLKENPALVKKMASIEKGMAGFNMRYVSKDRIEQIAHQIRDGDIIAFVTTIKGLDVSHTGVAIFQNQRLHLLHASLNAGEVEITSEPLSEYLKGRRNVSGILVARID
jgi:hypothetical protein